MYVKQRMSMRSTNARYSAPDSRAGWRLGVVGTGAMVLGDLVAQARVVHGDVEFIRR
jgi:hypothetical protein